MIYKDFEEGIDDTIRELLKLLDDAREAYVKNENDSCEEDNLLKYYSNIKEHLYDTVEELVALKQAYVNERLKALNIKR